MKKRELLEKLGLVVQCVLCGKSNAFILMKFCIFTSHPPTFQNYKNSLQLSKIIKQSLCMKFKIFLTSQFNSTSLSFEVAGDE